MRELEFQTQVLALLTRIADSCERAELRLPAEDEPAADIPAPPPGFAPAVVSTEPAPRGKRRGKRA